jgi:hypothetical protein
MKMELATAAEPTSLPSRYAIGEPVYFHPAIHDFTPDQVQQHALKAKIMAVRFTKSKVLYELALDTALDPGPAEYYEAIPLADVDSYFVLNAADAMDGDRLLADVSYMATGSNQSRTPQEIRQFAQYFLAVASDLPELRKEQGK